MKTLISLALLILGLSSNLGATKIEFSANLSCAAKVHKNYSTLIDNNGNIFIAGGIRDGLKVTSDSFHEKYNNDSDDKAESDIYLMKLSPEGELIYSSYIGGSQDDCHCNQIVMDKDENVYVGFTTDSKDLPVCDNSYKKSNKGVNDYYIIKFSKDFKYISSTYLGASESKHYNRLAVNHNILYLIGSSRSELFSPTDSGLKKKNNNCEAEDSLKQYMNKNITVTALSLELDKIHFYIDLDDNNYEAVNSFSFYKNGKVVLAGSSISDDFQVRNRIMIFLMSTIMWLL